MITIIMLAIEKPVGRKQEAIRAFGYREGDEARKIVEVQTSMTDAIEIIKHVHSAQVFPELEVDDKAWMFCVATPDTPKYAVPSGL